ncbi:AAA family ATPase [Hymenobacter terricola]|uniref:AAA family ATPase n=1 Tax=Hymenobacter terricola TaxID=2819236 RepID=UPI001B30E381|nr:ATP-binding protein [Hymenobacter terricola]
MMDELLNPRAEIPPFIKRVFVRDYAPLRKATVSFKRGLNIIIGKNGTGKTRFLTLLSDLADLQESKEHYWGAGCSVAFGGIFAEKDEVEVEFEEQDDTGLSNKPLAWDLVFIRVTARMTDSYSEHIREGRVVEGFLAHYPPVLVRHGIPVSEMPIIDESAELLIEKRNVTVQLRLGAKRVSDFNSQFIRAVLHTIVATIRNGFTVLRSVPVPPMTAEEVRHQLIRLMKTYSDRLTQFLPLYTPVQAVRCSEYFQVYHQELQDQYTIKGLVLEYQVNSEWLSFGMLSDGTKRLVYTVAELLAPQSVGLNKTTNEIGVYDRRKIIFLEEPELGIHPKQLTKLLNLIREISKENQVIMTTHSPQVLDMLSEKELDRITICELDPKKGTQFHKLTQKKQKQAREYMKEVGFLSDYWRYSFLEETEAE